MTIAILDPSAEDRSRIREALAGVVDGHFVEIDPTQPLSDEVLANARLVLLETDLPGDGGSLLLARLRGLRPDLPIVVVTRRVEEERIVAAMRAGASDHVGKDRLDRLPLAVCEAMARHEVCRDAEQALRQTQDRLRAALRSTDDLAHELSNALQPIRLTMDLLRRISDEVRRGKLLDSVVVSIERSRELLGRLMESARSEETTRATPDEPALPIGRQ